MELKELLKKVKNGEISVDEASNTLSQSTYDDIGFAKLDNHRALRRGFNEAVFCLSKTPTQAASIAAHFSGKKTPNVLFTKVSREIYEEIAHLNIDFEYCQEAKIIIINPTPVTEKHGTIAIVTGGTSDIGIAEEAAITASLRGNKIIKIYDAGVAGIHRLLSNMEAIEKADVIIAVAGMEGALASVVAGLTSKPVIAVPTSVGYGASFNGLAPLLTMLNSCAEGVGVVNIDNGFGAGCLAAQITKIKAK
jgi:NCAIR mutase (PurE)-related protein